MNPDAFWRMVDVGHADACWDWLRGKKGTGYGAISIAGRQYAAHRLAFEIHFDEKIGDGLFVCHACDRPACCNPSHLFLGTHAENMEDRNRKGRQVQGDGHWSRTDPQKRPRGDMHGSRLNPERCPRGEGNGRAKMSTDDVRTIRSRASTGASLRALARVYGLSKSTVRAIITRETWAHVP